jgi:CRISPR-associated protein Cst1
VFTGEPAVGVVLSAGEKEQGAYPPGRAFRHVVPMVTGEDVINFHPGGDAGLPISGMALLCIQAFPLGCAKCGGKLLAVHSDNPELMLKFAAKFLKVNRDQVGLAQESGSSKLPEAGASAKTLLVETLLQIEQARRDEREDHRPYSVTAYHLSNSGQSNPLDARNPPLEMYHLPLELTDFLGAITHVEYRSEWQAVERRAWRMAQAEKKTSPEDKPRKRKTKAETPAKEDTRPRRNFLYEDLLALPGNARGFIRRYLLRIPIRNTFEDDPRRSYSLKSDASLIKWKLTQLFLERVMRMKTSRIDRIRELGDQLAAYVHEENDQKFFATFYAEQRRYDVIRNALIKVNHARLKRGQPPVVKLDPYLEVFEDVDENGRSDWRLARDLVLIRMIERLYDLKWIEQYPEALPEVSDENAAE